MSINQSDSSSDRHSERGRRNRRWKPDSAEGLDFDHLSEASERAAKAFGQFISVATDITQTFGDSVVDWSDGRSRNSTSGSVDPEALQQAGEKLREFREAAGHTIESLAEAMQKEGARQAILAAESGERVFPKEWLEQAYSIIGASNPLSFYENFHACYSDDMEATPVSETDAASENGEAQSERAGRLAALFQNDAELESLTDRQFEVLLQFVDDSYRSAKKMQRSSG